jgi:hypothetical protein
MRLDTIQAEFVEFIPKVMNSGVLYISEKYKTASHLCACGCGEKVVTPLSPADWHLQIAGDEVSLHPSIGNWNYGCRSHYYIRRNRISWSYPMTKQQIARIQARDFADKEQYIATINRQKSEHLQPPKNTSTAAKSLPRRIVKAVLDLFRG